MYVCREETQRQKEGEQPPLSAKTALEHAGEMFPWGGAGQVHGSQLPRPSLALVHLSVSPPGGGLKLDLLLEKAKASCNLTWQ